MGRGRGSSGQVEGEKSKYSIKGVRKKIPQ
jgi:hypothetical protein